MKKAVPIIAVLLMLVSLPSRGQLPELERPEVLPASPEASKLATTTRRNYWYLYDR